MSLESAGPDSPRAEDVFAEYLSRHQRGGHRDIEAVCREHPELASKLRELDRQFRAFVPHAARLPAVENDETSITEPVAPQPRVIGPYHILDVIGEGGMGTVYLAEQREPVRRRVALKVIKLGMDTRAVLARFAVEQQSLAIMSHDSIAKVFDAGVTPAGQPFFAMEYVKGVPITRYCDEQKLSLDDRLLLFKQVCSGVQHAHTKGVIHRDLTPNNVLVTLQDGNPTPKIIDFGLARATDHRLIEKTVFTEQGMILGTPEYMSPEQAGLDALDIDMRTDVYTLGVLLYELLTGRLPFEGKELRAAGHDAMCRAIRESEPPRPSTKVTTAGDTETTARLRRTDASTLLRRLRGDLDWIVLKCLEKDRTRRYETVSELAADVQRHLDHEPVVARAPSLGYRLSKLTRRYRAQLVAVSAVFVALVLGLGAALYFWRRAVHSSAEALERKAEVDRLSSAVLCSRLLEQEAELWPESPRIASNMRAWVEQARGLLARRPGLEEILRSLHARARANGDSRPSSLHDSGSDLGLARLRSRVEAMRNAAAVRQGRQSPATAELPHDWRNVTARLLNLMAWERVAPEQSGERKVWGEEALGLALVEMARSRVEAGDTSAGLANVLDTMAWAMVALGRDGEALDLGRRALEAAPEPEKESYERTDQVRRQVIEDAAGVLQAAEEELARAQPIELSSDYERFLHEQVAGLLSRLDRFEKETLPDVEARLDWAERVRKESIDNHAARWAEARAAIQRADGAVASTRYRSGPVALAPQLGLVPIGKNPATGLWEFHHLRSAEKGSEIPAHATDGELRVTEHTGIVFVLLPGGECHIGAQSVDPAGPNHGPADPDEGPVCRVRLDPFFVSRYEVTQAQWWRLTRQRPSNSVVGSTPGGVQTITWSNPVEQVSWNDCKLWLARHDLLLPTEAQWEYACRAGTSGAWYPGEAQQLALHANVADETAAGWPWTREPWPDGHLVHAPVGSFRANPFGLHDVHGNVWEWTADAYTVYAIPPRPGDGLRQGLHSDSVRRVYRGGSFSDPAVNARSANRDFHNPDTRAPNLGLRPVRALDR